MAAVFVVMFGLWWVKIEEKIQESNQDDGDNRPEDKLKTVWLYFVPLVLFYFCIVSGEGAYQSNIFSVSSEN